MRRDSSDDRRFASKALIATAIVVAVVLVLLLVRQVASVLLVVFAGILLAVFLDGIAIVIQGLTKMRRPGALAIAIVIFFGFFSAAVWLVGPPVGTQIAKLAERLPSAIESVRGYLTVAGWGKQIAEWMPDSNQLLSMSTDVLKGVGGPLLGRGGHLPERVFVLFIGIYISVCPGLYVDNAVRLFPIPKRRRIREVFAALGVALRWWLVGRAASMMVVGILTALGLWIAGVPEPLALALIAALMAFVPFPWAGARRDTRRAGRACRGVP